MRVLFPHAVTFRQSQPRLVGLSLDTRAGISGAQSVTATMRGRWEIDITFGLWGEAAVLAWQAFVAQMEGRLGTTLVPVFTPHRPRNRDGHEVPFPVYGGFSDAQSFQHYGFGTDPAITARLTEAAALRATEIAIELGDTTGIRPGQYFSIGERLHRARLVWKEKAKTRVLFQPPLREAAAKGAVLALDRVHCLMRMAGEADAELTYRPGPFHEVSVTFTEAL